MDYFLFEEKQGYCDYYSSAMVVMLRAVGVPARYVRGYSQGQKTDGVYHVLKSDGHAWPEAFFPGYGWVEFEPTSGQPVLVRALSQEKTDDPAIPLRDRPLMDDEVDPMLGPLEFPDRSRQQPELADEPLWQRIGRIGWLALDLVAMGVVLVALFKARRQRQIEGLTVVERVYLDLVDWVRRLLRVEQLAHQTPHEYVGVVGQHVPHSRWAVQQIADSYVLERFGGREAPDESVEAAWSETWRALWGSWLNRRIDAVRQVWWKLIPPKMLDEEG